MSIIAKYDAVVTRIDDDGGIWTWSGAKFEEPAKTDTLANAAHCYPDDDLPEVGDVVIVSYAADTGEILGSYYLGPGRNAYPDREVTT